jgi:DNA-binding NarL/FixJ family response regulator
MSLEIVQHPHLRDSRRDWTQEPEEVSRIMEVHRLGLGRWQIAGELGLARNTIKRYLRVGGYSPYQKPRRWP